MNQLRTIPFIPKRPVKVTERLSRRPRGKDNLVDRYAVAGGEGFVIAGQEDEYKVTITQSPSCSCPDKIVPCKHMLFILLEILKLSETDPLGWQTFYMPHELKKIGISTAGPEAGAKRPGDDLESSPKRVRTGPLTTEGLNSAEVRTLLLSIVDKHPEIKDLVDQRRPTVICGISEEAMREVLLEVAKLHPGVATEIEAATERSNAQVVDFDGEVSEAVRVIHSIDYLRDSQQYSRTHEVTEPLKEIINSIPKRINAFSRLPSKKNALAALEAIGREMAEEASSQVRQALMGEDGGVEELEAAIVGLLEGLGDGTAKDEALARLQRLGQALVEGGEHYRISHYVQHGEDEEAGTE